MPPAAVSEPFGDVLLPDIRDYKRLLTSKDEEYAIKHNALS